MNTNKLISIAAIMAAGAMACEDNLSCTLYTEDNYGGTSEKLCLGNLIDGSVTRNLGYSFVNSPIIFSRDTLSSFKCGADVAMDVCAEGIGQNMVDHGDGKGLVKDWYCVGSLLLQTDGAGDEQATLETTNLANGIVLYHAPQPEPPTQTESCSTTLYYKRNCDAGLNTIDNGFRKKIELNQTTDIAVLPEDMPNVRSVLLREQSDIMLY